MDDYQAQKSIKNFVLFFMSLFLSGVLFAQNYQIRFTGIGTKSSVDSVFVENINQGVSLSLPGTAILQLQGEVGSPEILTPRGKSLRIFPNPSQGNCTVVFVAPVSGNVAISVFDLLGKQINSKSYLLSEGIHSFNIGGLYRGVYLLKINAREYSYTGKVVSNGSNSERTAISWLNSSEIQKEEKIKSVEVENSMIYSEGDILRFTAYSGIYKTSVTEIPDSSFTIPFPFVDCVDDDNYQYPIVKIGNQIWMAENLKTTKYNDGTAIPNVIDETEWYNSKSGAYCNYDNLESNAGTFGRLYNWHVINTSKIAPAGWHVPTDSDWTILKNYLIDNGYNYDKTKTGNKIAKSLCAKTNWAFSNETGTPGAVPETNNNAGFSALPGGSRGYAGGFYDFGQYSGWWSSTEDSKGGAFGQCLGYMDDGLRKSYGLTECGFSVRCIMDDNTIGLVEISSPKAEVVSLEFVNIDVKGNALNEEKYPGKFGNEQIELLRTSDSTLIFLVPKEVKPGKYNLSMAISKDTISFKVLEEEKIVDSYQYMDEKLENIYNDINDIDGLTENDTTLENDNREFFNILFSMIKDSLELYKSELKNLSPDELAVISKFISANTKNLDPIISEINSFESDLLEESSGLKSASSVPENDIEKTKYLMEKYSSISTQLLNQTVNSGWYALDELAEFLKPYFKNKIFELTKSNIALNVVLMLYDTYQTKNLANGLILASTPYHPIALRATDLPSCMSKSKSYEFYMRVVARNVNQYFNESDLQWERTFSTQLQEDIDGYFKWYSLKSWMDKIYHNYKNIELKFPKSFIGDLQPEVDNIIVKKTNISEDLGFMVYDNEEKYKFSLSFFNSTKGNFSNSIRFVYNNVYFEEKSDKFNIKLYGNEPKSIDYFKEKDLTNSLMGYTKVPATVIARDSLNNPVEGCLVNFQTNSYYTFPTTIETGPDGLATTEWYINTNSTDVQYMTATAFKCGTSNHLSGSELVFTINGNIPYSIDTIWGNNQWGTLGEILEEPIVVIVKDKDGNPFEGAKVNFLVNNGGTVSAPEVFTDSFGWAQTYWTLGSDDLIQTITVTAFQADGITPLIGSPITFSASIKKTFEFMVNSILPATDTQINLKPGMIIGFSASGQWCWGGTSQCSDADGTPGRPNKDEHPVLLEGANFGTLIGRVNSQYFKIGKSSKFTVPMDMSGNLFLQMNERTGCCYWDNSGSINVNVEILEY